MTDSKGDSKGDSNNTPCAFYFSGTCKKGQKCKSSHNLADFLMHHIVAYLEKKPDGILVVDSPDTSIEIRYQEPEVSHSICYMYSIDGAMLCSTRCDSYMIYREALLKIDKLTWAQWTIHVPPKQKELPMFSSDLGFITDDDTATGKPTSWYPLMTVSQDSGEPECGNKVRLVFHPTVEQYKLLQDEFELAKETTNILFKQYLGAQQQFDMLAKQLATLQKPN